MKLFTQNCLKALLTIALIAAITTTQAMEQQKEEIISSEVVIPNDGNIDTDTVVERICNAFNIYIDSSCVLPKPETFKEALARLLYIDRLLERAQIEPQRKLRKYFNITKEHCKINNIDVPHHMVHPIFKYWFQTACTKILLSHPKSLEAINIILERLSTNVFHENLELYKKAINSLPIVVAEYIKEQFREKHGWPHGTKPSKLDYFFLRLLTNGPIPPRWKKLTFEQALERRAEECVIF